MANDKLDNEGMDLTDDELNKIFFGDTESINYAKKEKEKLEKLKEIDEKFDNSSIVNPPKKNLDHLYKKKKPEKINYKKDGTPKNKPGPRLKWTAEKVKELRERKKRDDELSKESIISTGEPVSYYQQKQRLATAIKNSRVVKEEIIKKRESLKELNSITIKKTKKCKCEYMLSYIEPDSFMCVCKHCSALKRFTPTGWKSYISQKEKPKNAKRRRKNRRRNSKS